MGGRVGSGGGHNTARKKELSVWMDGPNGCDGRAGSMDGWMDGWGWMDGDSAWWRLGGGWRRDSSGGEVDEFAAVKMRNGLAACVVCPPSNQDMQRGDDGCLRDDGKDTCWLSQSTINRDMVNRDVGADQRGLKGLRARHELGISTSRYLRHACDRRAVLERQAVFGWQPYWNGKPC